MIASNNLPDTTLSALTLVRRVVKQVRPTPRMGTTAWSKQFRRMSPKSTALPGRYNPDLTPWVPLIHKALDDPSVVEVVGCKSAQIAWTDGVILNYVGRRIDIDPCPMIIMFPKEADAKAFDREKFTPMVEVTPTLATKIPIHKARHRDNSWDYKGFPGGFLKFVGSNSAGSVKSTPSPIVIVEEPDDANTNIKQQGDTIAIVRERMKSYARRKMIFGGTPTIDGFSRIWAAYLGSDQRKFWVPCPACSEFQVLTWDRVVWLKESTFKHEVFGVSQPETARYSCAHCGALWTDREKNQAVRKLEERAGAPFYGVAGFWINELYSPFPGSAMNKLVEKRLAAEHALAQGDDTKLRSFRNNTEGLPYAYKSTVPSVEKLKDRAEPYAELTVPQGALVLTCGVDVQHNRLAVVIRAWGPGEESWLVWWGEIYGRTMVVQWNDDGTLNKEQSGAWCELDDLLMGSFPHARGARLRMRAGTFDSGDGQTMDAVYAYVRKRLARGFMAGKGDSHDPKKDIFTPPKLSIDTTARQKPHPSGVKPYMVGTQVAKDLMLGVDEQGGRIKLLGHGPGRMHWPKTVRPDYWDQVTAEVKVPHKSIRGRMVWACQASRRNEALDCEVYALHAARSLKLHLWREERWAAEEAAVKQPVLFAEESAPWAVAPPSSQASAQAPDTTDATDTPAAQVDTDGVQAGTADKPAADPRQAAQTLKPAPAKAAPVAPPLRRGGWSATRW